MSITTVGVVIPARDEEELIGRCLGSVVAAARAVPQVSTVIVVVDHASTDKTSDVAEEALAGHPHLVVRSDLPSLGQARAYGVSLVLGLRSSPPEALWLAFTDADSVVGEDWLKRQLDWADAGLQAVCGIVSLPPEKRRQNPRYEELYAAQICAGEHGHVHGANMGMTAATYLAAGGFGAVAVGEDTDLWRRIGQHGMQTVADPRLVVETSARRSSRTVGGLATYLAQLQDEQP